MPTTELHANPNNVMTSEQMVELAKSRDTALRAAVAGRSDCPVGVLASLVHDGKPEVRRAIAGSPRLSMALSQVLENDKDSTVLLALLGNPLVDVAVIGHLSASRHPDVSLEAVRILRAMHDRADGIVRD